MSGIRRDGEEEEAEKPRAAVSGSFPWAEAVGIVGYRFRVVFVGERQSELDAAQKRVRKKEEKYKKKRETYVILCRLCVEHG